MRRSLQLFALAASVLLASTPVLARPAGRAAGPPTAPTAVDAPGSLAAMLGRMPQLALGGQLTYADVATQLAAVGVPAAAPGGEVSQERLQATFSLEVPRPLRTMHNTDWRDVFGFGLSEIDQAIEYAAPPRELTVYRGRFDRDALRRAWTNEGYHPVEVNGATIYTVRDDLEQELNSRSFRLALLGANHAAILDDSTIAFSSVRDTLTGAIAAAAGTGPSLAESVGIAPLLPHLPPDLVSAVLVDGDALVWLGDPAALLLEVTPGATDLDAIATQIAAQDAEARRMPPIVVAVLGQTAGGPLSDGGATGDRTPPPGVATARAVAALTTIHHGAAEAAATVIEGRLATQRVPEGFGDFAGRAYADLFPDAAVNVPAGEPVVIVELTPAPDVSPNVLARLVLVRALTLFAWSP